jgi:hypothetical protein
VYERDVQVHRGRSFNVIKPGGKRGTVSRLSDASRRRLIFSARNLGTPLPYMLTLTYPAAFPADGEVVKRHWANLRRWLAHRGIGGLMILEFQKRGAPHYHAYITGEVDKQEVSRAWYDIVGSGDPKHLQAGTRVEKIRKAHGMLTYIVKYASKLQQKDVPEGYENVGRFWSLFGGLKVEPLTVLQGERSAIAPVVRLVRNAWAARRRSAGLPRKSDWGHVGFRAYDVGRALLAWAGRLGLSSGLYCPEIKQAETVSEPRILGPSAYLVSRRLALVGGRPSASMIGVTYSRRLSDG